MVGGKRISLTEYAEARGTLTTGKRRIFAARHPILEITCRNAADALRKLAAAERELDAEKRKRKDAESRSADTVRSLAHLGHDINNILTGLQATVEMLKIQVDESGMPEGARNQAIGDLNLILDECHRISHDMASAIEMNNPTNGRSGAACAEFDACRESARVVGHLEVLANKKGIYLTFKGGDPLVVRSDHRLFDRVLSNVVGNALKYTVRGGITVSVARDGKDAVISVEDTGPGIGEAELGSIFDEYRRGASSNGTPGKGLGLYIAKTYAERMGGSISVESELGKGSKFTLTFPAADG